MDKNTFEKMARTWRMKALITSKSCGAGSDEAEDIAQDVMLRLWQMHARLEDCRSVEALSALIARRLTINLLRRKLPEPIDVAKVVALGDSPQEWLENRENEEWLTRQMEQLPSTQRALIYMRQVERHSHEDIARLLGIGAASVGTLLARARKALLEEVKRRD